MELRLRVPPEGGLRAVRPRGAKTVGIYVCGPTVYGDAHVGHGRTYLVFDMVRRHLEANGQRVRLVMNITDFEDRIFERARTLRMPWRALARQAERRFLAELGRLNLLPPQVTPRASEHIAEMRAVGARLQNAGCVHRVAGDLVYHPTRSHRSSRPLAIDLQRRVVPERGENRGTPDDSTLREFAIWQAPRAGGPRWPSPWGPGTPGWHLECYVMARRYLGLPVDLHGGGRDLIFPHHYAENEIAETLDHRPFARRFLHTGFVLQDGEKMAKSTGHLVRLRTAIDEAGAGAVRWYLLSRHYAAGLEWDEASLAESARKLERVRRSFRAAFPTNRGTRAGAKQLADLLEAVTSHIANDLDTPSVLQSLVRAAQQIRPPSAGRPANADWRVVQTRFAELEARLGFSVR